LVDDADFVAGQLDAVMQLLGARLRGEQSSHDDPGDP
jgi:hypothetical protein